VTANSVQCSIFLLSGHANECLVLLIRSSSKTVLPFGHDDQIIGQTQSIAFCFLYGSGHSQLAIYPAKLLLSPASSPCLPFVSVEAQEGVIDLRPLQDCLLDTVSDANPATEWAISNQAEFAGRIQCNNNNSTYI